MDDLLRTTAERAARYLTGLDGRAVSPAPEAIARLVELGGPLPDGPSDPGEVVRLLDGLQAAGYDVLNDVTLNQVLVSFGDDATTRRVIAAIQSDGTCWCGGTTWQGRTAMRISVSSWATTDADVERSLTALLRAADGVAGTDYNGG